MSVKLSTPIGEGIYKRDSGSIRDVEYYLSSEIIPKEIGFGEPKLIGDCFYIIRHWYAGSRDLFEKLHQELEWHELHLMMYGKPCKMKRLIHVMSDRPSFQSTAWSPEVREIKNRLEKEINLRCDSSILNLYKTGEDFIPYHSDHGDGGYPDVVATVSLGGTRRFYLKNIKTNEIIKTELHSGDLVIMSGNIQRTHKHSIPKQKGVQSRISITFRQ